MSNEERRLAHEDTERQAKRERARREQLKSVYPESFDREQKRRQRRDEQEGRVETEKFDLAKVVQKEQSEEADRKRKVQIALDRIKKIFGRSSSEESSALKELYEDSKADQDADNSGHSAS